VFHCPHFVTKETTVSEQDSLSRRSALEKAIAAVVALGCVELSAEGSEAAPFGFFPGAKTEPQKFPFGWIRWLMSSKIDPHAELTLGIVHVEAQQSNPLHIHPNSAEILYMLSGTCEHLVGDRWVTLKAGDTLRIPKGIAHRARTKDQPFEAVIVYDTPTRQMVTLDGERK
jgi:quercetin dioxygenase-like cupin family protein